MLSRLRQSSAACVRCQTRTSGLLSGAGSRSRAFAPLSQHSLRARRAYSTETTEPNEACEPAKAAESESILEAVEKAETIVEPAPPIDIIPEPSEDILREPKENRPLVRWTNEPSRNAEAGAKRHGAYLSEAEWARKKHLSRANLQEKFAPVNVDSLGKPSNIVVLREHVSGRGGGLRYVTDNKPDVVIEQEKVDILSLMKEDIGVVGTAEIVENIGSLRPEQHKKRSGKGRTYAMTWEEIMELEKKLTSGFTKTQMMAYIQDYEAKKQKAAAQQEAEKKEEEEEVEEEDKDFKIADWLSTTETQLAKPGEEFAPHILNETRWMPGRSEHGHFFEDSALRGYTSDAATAKSKVAMFIIRSCWRIRCKEYDSVVGEIEVKLAPEDLELLLSPRSRAPPLKKISDALVTTENEKVEAYRTRDVVRITGTPKQANRIARAIENVLANIRTYKVSLKELKRDGAEFNNAVYEELERLTNSEVTRLSKDSIVIKGMNLQPGSGLSTMADVARRVLLQSSDAADQVSKNVGYKITDKPAYAVEYSLQESMSWRNKMRHWARWEAPIEKLVEKPVDVKEYIMELDDLKAEEAAFTPKEEVAAAPPKDELIPVAESEAVEALNVAEGALWQARTRESYAMVGNLLHEQVIQTTVDPKPVSFDVKDGRTLFITNNRNFARLVDRLPAFESRQRVFLKFLPSPWTPRGGEALNTFPAVEMEFQDPAYADAPLVLNNVHAISEEVHHDIMLPDKTLDLSFRQRQSFKILSKKAMQVPQIADFLTKSRLNPSRSEVLTPAELTLPIPSYICRNPGSMFGEMEQLDVPYLFAGLEFRESATFNYHNWLLRYRTINGGKAAGQWSELSLDYQRTSDAHNVTSSSELENQNSDEVLRSFTTATFRLVDDLDTPRPTQNVENMTATAEGEMEIKHEHLPSVRRCGVSDNSRAAKAFACFNHRPLLRVADEATEAIEEVEDRLEERL